MKMEELNKTQLILLAILLSFITSIATGIVTVTLMEQAPPGVTQTINRIVERTIETVVPEKGKVITQTVVVKEENFIIDATEKNQDNVVKIGYLKQQGFSFDSSDDALDIEDNVKYVATGFIVSTDGFVVVDKRLLSNDEDIVVKNVDSIHFRAEIVDNTHEHLTLLKISSALSLEDKNKEVMQFNKPTFIGSGFVRVGQTGISLGFDNGILLLLGVVSQIDMTIKEDGVDKDYIYRIYTTVNLDKRYSGGPMINTDGDVVGISIIDKSGDTFVVPSREVIELLKSQNEDDVVAVGDVQV